MESRAFFYEFGRMLYRVDGFYADYARESGVKENLLWILYALNDGEEHSQKEICESWDLPRTTVNTIVKELKDDGLVALSQIPGEKRELRLKLTARGQSYADEVLKPLYGIEKKAFEAAAPSDLLGTMAGLLACLQAEKEKSRKENRT